MTFIRVPKPYPQLPPPPKSVVSPYNPQGSGPFPKSNLQISALWKSHFDTLVSALGPSSKPTNQILLMLDYFALIFCHCRLNKCGFKTEVKCIQGRDSPIYIILVFSSSRVINVTNVLDFVRGIVT